MSEICPQLVLQGNDSVWPWLAAAVNEMAQE